MHIHFIGIAGSLIAPIAVALKKKGYKITGSDKAFYPPASTLLEENKIKITPGFKNDKFKDLGKPDLAVLMSFLTEKNPEVIWLKNKKVPVIGLGQLLEKFFIKGESVVVIGNAGKTTTTSMISWLFENAGIAPSILVGGVMNNLGTGVKITNKKNDIWTITEGDEFKNWHISKKYEFTKRSRINYQEPKYVVLTGATWDHYDLYPTKKDYVNNFKKYVNKIEQDGLVVANLEGENVEEIISEIKAPVIGYLPPDKDVTLYIDKFDNIYQAQNINYKNKGSSFEIFKFGKNQTEYLGTFDLQMYGKVNITNATAAIALADQLGISDEKIWQGISSFHGIKRRQENRFENKKYIVFDDFACSPIEIKKILESLKIHYSNNKILVVYQPGSKDDKAFGEYNKSTFKNADKVFLPRVSSISKKSKFFNEKLYKRLNGYNKEKFFYTDDDKMLVKQICNVAIELYKYDNKKVVVLFAAQKGFRNMIEDTISFLQKK